jgi:hypothetical protein
MQPNLITKFYESNRPGYGVQANEFIKKVITEFENIEYDTYFKKPKVKPPEQKIIVNTFQNDLCDKLNVSLKTVLWATETSASETFKDRFDLSYEVKLDNLDYFVIIELDKCRSDQISKKFVSRTCHTLGKPTIYFTFCYPGTKSMSYEECVKYIGYCEAITDNLNCEEIPWVLVGLLMGKKHKRKKRKTTKSVKATV